MKSKNKIDKTKDFPKKVENKNITVSVLTFFEDKLARHSLKILLALIFLIGFIVFNRFFRMEYLFYFLGIGSDSLTSNMPELYHIINVGQEGLISRYSFYSGMGDTFYRYLPTDPLGWILRIIDEVGISAYGVDYLIKRRFYYRFFLYFMGTGTIFYLYLRTIDIKQYTALIGALLISFSGYLVVGTSWDFDSHVFKAAFLLFAFEQLHLKKRWYFFPFAIMFLSTNVFVFYIYTVFFLTYTLFRYFSDSENSLLGYIKLGGKMLGLAIAGMLMNTVTIFYSFLKMYNSPRVTGNASYVSELIAEKDLAVSSDLISTTIYRFFSNDMLGVGSDFKGWGNYLEAPLFYIGIFTLLIFPQIFTFLTTRKKIIFGSFFAFWVSTLLIPHLRRAILLFFGDYFRYGFDFFIPFAFLILAIYSLNEIDKNFKINLPLLIITFAGLSVLLFVPFDKNIQEFVNEPLRRIVFFLMIVYGYLIFLFSKPHFRSLAQILLLLVIVFELTFFSHKSYATRDALSKSDYEKDLGGYKDGSISSVNYVKSIDKNKFYRIEKNYQSGDAMHASLNDAKLQGYYGTSNYSSFNQVNYVRFLEELEMIQKGEETATRWIRGLRETPLLQSFASVKYHLSKEEKPFFLNVGFDSIAEVKGVKILKNNYYLPLGYTYDKYIDYSDFKKLIFYKITQINIQYIEKDLTILAGEETAKKLTSKLSSILDVRFDNAAEFKKSLENILGADVTDKYFKYVAKYAVDNFACQTELLNGFVYEKDEYCFYEITDFEKIEMTDSNRIISADGFNFDYYKQFTDSLKIDTFQITDFKQHDIKGKISLKKTKMLFFSIPYDQGWHIIVNGTEQKLSRVNLGFCGIVLTEGEHDIELFFEFPYTNITSLISIISIILFWGFLIFHLVYKRIKKEKI